MRGATKGLVGAALAVSVLAGACGGDGDDAGGGSSERLPAVQGFLSDQKGTGDRDDDELLEGIDVVVTDADGEEVGRSTSTERGIWSVVLPGAGRYTASLGVAALPDGVEVEDDTLEVEVDEREQTVAPFHLNAP